MVWSRTSTTYIVHICNYSAHHCPAGIADCVRGWHSSGISPSPLNLAVLRRTRKYRAEHEIHRKVVRETVSDRTTHTLPSLYFVWPQESKQPGKIVYLPPNDVHSNLWPCIVHKIIFVHKVEDDTQQLWNKQYCEAAWQTSRTLERILLSHVNFVPFDHASAGTGR